MLQIPDLPDLAGRLPFSVGALEGRQIGPAFVLGNGLGGAVLSDGLLEGARTLTGSVFRGFRGVVAVGVVNLRRSNLT